MTHFAGGATAVANFCNKLADKNKRGMTLAYPMLISYLLSLLPTPSRSKHGRAVRSSRSPEEDTLVAADGAVADICQVATMYAE